MKTKQTKKYVALLFFFASTMSTGMSAYAADCDIIEIPDHELEITGDTDQRTDGWCHSSVSANKLDMFWEDLGFYERWWDDGFGFNDKCNPRLGLARLMNSIDLIYRSPSYGVMKAPATSYYEWITAGYYGQKKVRRIRAKCDSSVWPGSNSSAYFATRTIYFYWNGLFNNQVATRAGSLVHERGHLVGKQHDGNCTNSAGIEIKCDSEWYHKGPYYYHVRFLRDYHDKHTIFHINGTPVGCFTANGQAPNQSDYCYQLTEAHLDIVNGTVIYILEERFEQDPNFRVAPRPRIWVLDPEPPPEMTP